MSLKIKSQVKVKNDEKLAKTQFLALFENLFEANNSDSSALNDLPTAYDYIRLGHPLSCLLEWAIANLNNTKPENVISLGDRLRPELVHPTIDVVSSQLSFAPVPRCPRFSGCDATEPA